MIGSIFLVNYSHGKMVGSIFLLNYCIGKMVGPIFLINYCHGKMVGSIFLVNYSRRKTNRYVLAFGVHENVTDGRIIINFILVNLIILFSIF